MDLRHDPFEAALAPIVAELHAALAASGTGTWRWEADTGAVRWDATLEQLSGLRPGEFGGTFDAWLATLHPDEIDGILAKVNEAIDHRSAYHFEHRAMWPDGTVRWLECRGQVTTDADGRFTGTVGCAVDVTDRKIAEAEREAALERERRIRDRIQLLDSLTAAALTAPDHRTYMRWACSAVVPELGDWCSIHFLPEPGATIETVVAHADAGEVAWEDIHACPYPYRPSGDQGVAAVISSGRPELVRRVTEGAKRMLIDLSHGDPVLGAPPVRSVMTVPLTTTRGVIGAVELVSAESGRVYDDHDLALTKVVAGRIADALHTMWLTDRYRHISATLQQALLPPALPSIPGVEIAVRYWPAGAAIAVGGDFYDVFALTEDRWSVLIGDACGTGPDAAALSGIARHTVRAAARHGGDHRAVCEWLNEALMRSDRDRFCTAVYATLEASGDRWRLTTAAAGHPLPVLVPADGEPRALGDPGTLLGVYEELKVEPAASDLDVGDVVVFYTDGVCDVRPPHGLVAEEVAGLVGTAARLGSAEEIADAIGAAVTDQLPLAEREDDIAIVVLRVAAPPGGEPA